ncbi:MAG: cytochrome C oxidase subunit IV family protein [Bacteroidota bacterium]|nr:cytochrome C oxidase subunit IV family protein [Bacteroidota bacterium]
MSDHHSQENVHVVDYGKYIFVWLSLLAFTGITVSVSGINLGNWTVVIALVIASVKSWYVLNYFMHLRHEDIVFKIFISVALITLAIFVSLTFLDYSFVR